MVAVAVPALMLAFHVERRLIVAGLGRFAQPAPVASPAGVAVERDIVFAPDTLREGEPLMLDLFTPVTPPPGKLPVRIFSHPVPFALRPGESRPLVGSGRPLVLGLWSGPKHCVDSLE